MTIMTTMNAQAGQVLATGMIDVALLAPAGINPNRLYTTKEAADILACPVRTVSYYLQKGIINGQKLGPRNWRVSGTTLLHILTHGTAQTQTQAQALVQSMVKGMAQKVATQTTP